MEQITKAELLKRYTQRQAADMVDLIDRMVKIANGRDVAGWFIAECQALDSSRAGELVILPFGLGCTFKEPPAQPFSPRGLASDMSVAVAYTVEK
jgi:hypothetical protein